MTTPPGECPQCWAHSKQHSKNWLGIGEKDCQACLDHMYNGCPNIVPKKAWYQR